VDKGDGCDFQRGKSSTHLVNAESNFFQLKAESEVEACR